MLFFKIILALFIFMILLGIAIVLSTIELRVFNLKIDTRKNKKIEEGYVFSLSLKLLGFLKWFRLKIDSKKLNKILKSKKINKAKLKIIKNLLDDKKNFVRIKEFKILKILNIKLKELKLYSSFDLEDVNLTTYFTAILGSTIGILIGNSAEKFDNKKYNYIITPEYTNKNFLKLNLNCIFNVKIVHIINVIYLILQKRSEVKYARTSNRRTYDYSNE